MLDGKAFGEEIVATVREFVGRTVEPLLARIDELERRLAALPVPRDGKDGRDADPEAIERAIAARLRETVPVIVADAVSALPKPREGVDGKDGQEGQPGPQGDAGAAGAPGRDGRDGLDAVEFLRNADGHLIVTLSNGQTRDLGLIEAKDGAPGLAGRDGERGADGRDGFGFDDLDLVETGKGIFLRFTRGEAVKEFRLPVVVDRGVWKEGGFMKGDGVTWGGSFWIAQEDTADKPDTGKGWRLAVKKGRDGKDGSVRDLKPAGPVKVGTRATKD